MRYSAVVSITLALFATTAIAAPASKLLCAIVDVFDCSGPECTEVTSEAVRVPDLVFRSGREPISSLCLLERFM